MKPTISKVIGGIFYCMEGIMLPRDWFNMGGANWSLEKSKVNGLDCPNGYKVGMGSGRSSSKSSSITVSFISVLILNMDGFWRLKVGISKPAKSASSSSRSNRASPSLQAKAWRLESL